ncbi:MAG: HAD family hydrolase [Bacilli bacterium]|nr:HAD family hydrolase [Bacilli bacterium]
MKAVLFDLYGTLIDIRTDEENDKFWKNVSINTIQYKKIGQHNLKKEYLKLCYKHSIVKEEIELLDVFKELYGVDDEKAKEIAVVFRGLSTKYIRTYKGVKTLLKTLKENDFKIYLLSNAQEIFTLPELDKLGLTEYFDGIAISSKYGIKKPNKEFYKRAIEDFNIDGEILMVGNDYECDVKPAIELGLKSLFIETNLTPKNNVKDKIRGFNYKKVLKAILSKF